MVSFVELVSAVSTVVFVSPLGPVPQENMLCGLILAAVSFVCCCVASAAAASAVYASSEIPMSDGGIPHLGLFLCWLVLP